MEQTIINKLIVILLTVLVIILAPEFLQAEDSEFTIQGEWLEENAIWSGPLVVDLNNDGEKEIIIIDESRIRVYEHDAEGENPDPCITLYIPDQYEHYQFFCIPSVGNLDDDDFLEIVAVCGHKGTYYRQLINKNLRIYCNECDRTVDQNCRVNESVLLVWDVSEDENEELDASLITSFELFSDTNPYSHITGSTPVLADLQGLEDSEEQEVFDERMEIVLTGLGWDGSRHNGPNGLCSARSGHYTSVMVFQLNADNDELTPLSVYVSSLSAGIWHLHYDGEFNSYSIAAVGDIDCDGMKEIAVCDRLTTAIWSYNASGAINNKLTNRQLREVDVEDNAGFYVPGPVLADIENAGELNVIVPQFLGTEEWETMVWVMDRDAENLEAWEDEITGYFNLMGELPAIGDMTNNGTPEIILHLLDHDGQDHFLYCREFNNSDITGDGIDVWPVENSNLEAGAIPTIMNIYDGDAFNDIVIANEINGDDVLLYSLEDSDDPVDGWLTDNSPDYSIPCLSELKGDGDIYLIVQSISDGIPTEMEIRIIDTGTDVGDDNDNERVYNEWSQLMNSPRHDGLYAQVYSGFLQNEETYWRDRVILTSEVTVGENKTLTILPNTVVEFNSDVDLRIFGGQLNDAENVVFKPNFEGEYRVYYDPGPMKHLKFLGDRMINGRFIIEESQEITFENCTFSGESGIGDHIAIDAEDATVNLINCTFKGYDTAVMLDN
ncbi:MAG: hypothetical protein P9X24_18260, partial [Candidatus Hatepunaea meridiana]|nr:hypothetical protein [Candidatus Hatepunaea meridiana]